MKKASLRKLVACSLSMLVLAACKSKVEEKQTLADQNARSASIQTSGGEAPQVLCEAAGKNYQVSEYDTTGDQVPDVRKVTRREGTAPNIRTLMVCREVDLDGNGTKDVVRFYNEQGLTVREEVDRNFDGRMDELSHYEDGELIRQELDTNGDGLVDTKIYYVDGKMSHAERDLEGKSTAKEWRPTRWEYYENGRVIRMGTDVTGDGKVDRWDRNEGVIKEGEQPEYINDDEPSGQTLEEDERDRLKKEVEEE